MTVEKLRNYEPLFGSWTVESKLAEGRHSKVFKVAYYSDGKARHQCVKTIKFPSGNEELSKVISSGIYQNVQQYLDEVEASVIKNMEKMLSLRSNKNIVRFDNYTIIKESSCFYLVILMELLTPLNEYLKADSAVQNDVIRIGTDICSALEGFRGAGIIHHDVKPENIYVDKNGNFKLGDFGVCKGRFGENNVTSSYIAPELYKSGSIDVSSDIYSVGILLYKLLNNNRLPFLPQYPAPVSLSDREEAFKKRLRGDIFPAPGNATPSLSAVIFKACAHRAHERYLDPASLKRDLEANYMFAPTVVSTTPPPYQATAIRPVAPSVPLSADPYQLAENSEIPLYNKDDEELEEEREEFAEAFAEDETEDEGEKVNKKWYFIIIALVVILAALIAFFAKGKGDKKEITTSTTAPVITFGQETTTQPLTESTTEATTAETTTETTTAQTTEATTETTTAPFTSETPSAVTTTTDPNTTKATLPSTTQPSTSEPSTQEPVTESDDPNLIYNRNVEGGTDTNGRVYTSVSAVVSSSFSGRDVTVKITGLSGTNATVDESKIYIYTLGGERPLSCGATATLVPGSDGSVSCFITAEDESFTYDPESFRYYVYIEEDAIKTNESVNLGVQVRV